jgi:oligopeptidase B
VLVEKRWWNTATEASSRGSLRSGIELRQELRHHHALVDDGARRQATGRRTPGPRLQLLLGAPPRHEQLAVEGGLVDVRAGIDEHLLDARQRLQRLGAAGVRVGRHHAKAGHLQLLALQLSREHSARARGRQRGPVQEHQPAAKRGASLIFASCRGHRAQEFLGFLSSRPQPSPVLPSAAMAPRCVSRFSELMAVCTTQWLGWSSRLAIRPKPQDRPQEERLYAEILGRLKQDDSSVPYLKDGYWYYRRFEMDGEYPIYARREDSGAAPQAPEQVLLDGNELARGHDYYHIGTLEVSPDTHWLAWCEDIVGRREYRLRFMDLRSGETHSTTIEGVEPDIAWANDNRTVLYIAKDPDTLLGLYVRKHLLGTDGADDPLIFEQTDHSFYTGVSRSRSGKYLFISMESTVASEWRYADADSADLAFTVFLPHQRDHEYQIDHRDDEFIIRSNWRARNFRLCRAPVAPSAGPAGWAELVAHREEVLIEDFEVFSRFVALSVRSGGLAKISILSLGDGSPAEQFIASDEPAYAMSIDANPRFDARVLRYSYTSLTTPTSIYDYDPASGTRTLLKREPVLGEFRVQDYATEFLFAPARDGARIPVSLVYRRGFVRNGAAPLLQYAYGAYGLSMDPAFSAARLSLLDRGFVFAIAHVRGGQEMGRGWYDDGRLLHKMNSFFDFLDVTHHLVRERYADPAAVFGMGGSAGGLLIGAVANLSPQDYCALVAQVPFVDIVTTMQDDSIPLTSNEYDEWGNPARKPCYDYMLAYSPYDNVRAQAYPAMLVTTGLWDSQVQYFEPAKWVAKLRSLKTDANPLYLRVDMESGHGGKSGRFQRYRDIATEYAFILERLADSAAAGSARASRHGATPGDS